MINKAFGIGAHRTGTSSLRRAFNILGFKCLEKTGCWFMCDIDGQGDLVFNESSDLQKYQGYADFPVPLFFRELDLLFPRSKFILTHRNTDEWARSIESIFDKWWDLWTKLPEWPLINACHQTFYGTDRPNRAQAERAYRRHNDEVRRYFQDRPDRLLELDVTSEVQWMPLCQFLGVPVPRVPYPRLNARPG